MINGEVVEVKTKKDLKAFIELPYSIYGKTFRNWVPPLDIEIKERLNKKKYPFFEYSDSAFFIYKERDTVLGRITASVNHRFNEYFNEKTGFFGFFESVHRQYVADSLFARAADWLKANGMNRMMGPFNLSTNEEGGLLIKGFDRPPMIMMTYNPEYYVDLYEGFGLKKIKELWAWYVDKYRLNLSQKMLKLVSQIEKRSGIVFRTLNMKKLDDDVLKIKDIYNEAWRKNWGFVPYTDAEIEQLAKSLRMIVDPSLVIIAEVNDEPAGFIIGLRDINELIIDFNGRLFSFGILRLFFGMKKIKHMRVVTLGVKEKFRRKGIDAVLYCKLIKNALDKGMLGSEMSWILDDNHSMNNILKKLNAVKYKRYGIYGMAL